MRTVALLLVLFLASPLLADEPKGAPTLSEQIDRLKKLGARITLDDEKRVIGVNLGERRVTDADLVHLRGLHHLQELDLTRTKITGGGLVNIKDLTALRRLFLTVFSAFLFRALPLPVPPCQDRSCTPSTPVQEAA